MTRDDLQLLGNDAIAPEVRVALAQAIKSAEVAREDRTLERERMHLDRHRFLWNTPIVAALAGLVTLSATFLFDRMTAQDTTQNTITLEQVRQELSESNVQLLQTLEKDKALTDAEINARAREREFQYEIVKSELTDADKTNAERAAVLLFLVRAGVLSSLNREELEEMTKRQIENPDAEIIPRLTPSTVAPGIIGPDDARPVSEYPSDHPVHAAAAAVGQLQIRRGGATVSSCTAFLIGADRIATASHCLDGAGEAVFELLPGTRGASSHAVDLAMVSPMRGTSDQVATATIAPASGPRITPLRIGPAPETGAQLGIVYFRGFGSAALAIWGGEACRALSIENQELRHYCDTGGGSSGAPVFDFASRQVVGVHYARSPDGGIAILLPPS